MNRRTFLERSLRVAPLVAWAPLLAEQAAGNAAERKADVVIIGGGLGGCAAALAALQAGLKVILTEETDWIGGQITSQGVPPDEHPWIESFGCTRLYRRYRDDVRAYYREHYPLTAAARANPRLNPGNGWVSRLCHEPRVGLAVLQQMLAPHLSGRRLQLLLESRPIAAQVEGDRVLSVTVQDKVAGRQRSLVAPYFIDATELGDLLPMAKVEHVMGSEARSETGEPHAVNPANPANQQAITWCFALDYLPGEDHTIDKPEEYAFWRDYVPSLKPPWPGRLLSWEMSNPLSSQPRRIAFDPSDTIPELNLWKYRRLADPAQFTPGTYPASISLINWPQNDYWLGPLAGVSDQEAAQHLRRARQLSFSLLYWMQTEAPRPDGGAGWKGLRLRGDLLGTSDGLAKYPYIRESRRILPEFRVVEQHVSTDDRMKATGSPRNEVVAAPFPDSVGVGLYRIDLHPSTGGDNYIDLSCLPFQIPLGALLPQRVENVFPACKNIGTTHITNGAFRLHPVEWNIGEAVGNLVAFALRRKEPPRQIRRDPKLLAEFQQMLRLAGIELEWPRPRPL